MLVAMPHTVDPQLVTQLKALGDPVRLRLVQILPKEPDCCHKRNVSQLAEELGIPQPTVSCHLKVLRQAGLVEHRKMCRDSIYWVDAEAVDRVVGALSAAARPAAMV